MGGNVALPVLLGERGEHGRHAVGRRQRRVGPQRAEPRFEREGIEPRRALRHRQAKLPGKARAGLAKLRAVVRFGHDDSSSGSSPIPRKDAGDGAGSNAWQPGTVPELS